MQVIGTIAGTGTAGYSGDGGQGTAANLNYPQGIALDADGNIYVADVNNHRVRRVDRRTGIIVTVAGTGERDVAGDGGPATKAKLVSPTAVALDKDGNLYISDAGRIRMVDHGTGQIMTVAGTGLTSFVGDGGPATAASFGATGLAVDSQRNIYIADYGNNRIRRVDGQTGVITTVAGNGDWTGFAEGQLATSVAVGWPWGVAVDRAGNVYVTDTFSRFVRRIDMQTGAITTVVGASGRGFFSGDGGLATQAGINAYGIAVDMEGSIFLAEPGNNRVRKVDVQTGIIATVAGSRGIAAFGGDGGPARDAYLHGPNAVAVDSTGNLYIADTLNHRVRKVSSLAPQPPIPSTTS